MTRAYAGLIFDPEPVRRKGAWHVYAMYPGGNRGHIISFDSEAAAKAWLKRAMAAQHEPTDVADG
jgi:hypothetical protein